MNLATRNEKSTADFFEGMADDDFGPVGAAPARKSSRFEKRTPTDRAETLYSEPCSKCGGSGWIPAYGHREQGRCFKCDGKGVLTFKTPKATRDANKIKSAERKERKLDENLATFEAENPAIATWWKNSTFPFALSLKDSVRSFGSLTPGQHAAALRCIEKFNSAKKAKEAQQAAATAEAKPVDISPIAAAFERAKARGLKRPKMHLLGNDQRLVFSRAPDTGKNAGAVYVKDSSRGEEDSGEYLGKIQNGKFFRSRECSDMKAAAVVAACVDPENAAIAFGKTFGICSCCGRELSDPVSVANGIGPICAVNFFG